MYLKDQILSYEVIMKKAIGLLVLVIFMITLNAKVVKVGAFNYYPAIYQESDGKIQGFYVDLLNYIGEKENIQFEYIYGSWSEGMDRLQKGEVDLLTSVAYSEERSKIMDYCPTKLLTVWGSLYTKPNSGIDGILESEGHSIGIMKGDMNAAHFKTFATGFGVNCNYVEYAQFSDVFAAVRDGKVDAGVANMIFGTASYSKYGLKPTNIVFNPFDIFFTVKKGENADIIALLDRYLKKWQEEDDSIYHQSRTRWLYGIGEDVSKQKYLKRIIIAVIIVGIVTLALVLIFTRNRFRLLNRKHERTEALFKNISDSLENGFVYQIDAGVSGENRHLLFISKGIKYILGYSPEEILKNQSLLFEAIDTKDELYYNNIEVQALEQKRIITNEISLVSVNGKTHWLTLTIIPHKDENNHLILDGIALDITHQKESDEKEKKLTAQLHQSQKMEAVGQLAGGVAHDFNNALGVIMCSVELLKAGDLSKSEETEYLEMIATAGTRAADLTSKLLAFSRQGIKTNTTVDCSKIISDTVALLGHTINKNISIKIENKAVQSHVIADYSMLQNAFMNMGINASHAMPNGGVLTFTIENIELDSDYCSSSSFDIKPGDYLKISVRDTGCGMTPETQSHIFEPFFTTKEAGKGTGLGLSAVFGTIQEYYGAITVYSEVNVGTIFHIYFPLASKITHEEKFHKEIIRGSGTILVIDDEYPIRLTASALLQSIGYKVLLASDGLTGVETFKKNLDEINLIILDMIMPVMGGREAFCKLRELKSDIPIIVSSGFAKEEDLNELKKQKVNGFLNKPFRKIDLAETIANILNKDQ